jgi:hypothetical protein
MPNGRVRYSKPNRLRTLLQRLMMIASLLVWTDPDRHRPPPIKITDMASITNLPYPLSAIQTPMRSFRVIADASRSAAFLRITAVTRFSKLEMML